MISLRDSSFFKLNLLSARISPPLRSVPYLLAWRGESYRKINNSTPNEKHCQIFLYFSKCPSSPSGELFQAIPPHAFKQPPGPTKMEGFIFSFSLSLCHSEEEKGPSRLRELNRGTWQKRPREKRHFSTFLAVCAESKGWGEGGNCKKLKWMSFLQHDFRRVVRSD